MTVEATFRGFIDGINARQWTKLGQLVGPGQVTYNQRSYSHSEFLAKMEERIGALPDGGFELETGVSDEEAQVMGARIVYRTLLPEEWVVEPVVEPAGGSLGETPRISEEGRPAGRWLAGVHHLFCWLEHGKVARIETIGDVDGVFRDEPALPNPQASPSFPSSSSPSSSGRALSATELSDTYRAYVNCINARTMTASLPQFCHREVVHNGRRLTLAEYEGLMADSQAAIRDMSFSVHTLVVDAVRQTLAVRLEFEGTPVRRWAGVEPGGGPVRFSEHVFYWLSGGRICEVLSLVDLAAYRAQVKGLEPRPGSNPRAGR